MQGEQDLQIHRGTILGNHYEVEDFLGQGGFGVVTKCRNIETNKRVAIKVNKNRPETLDQAKEEIAMLKLVCRLDPDTCNIIRWNGFFFNKTDICLNFELLDLSLYDYMVNLEDEVLPVTDVRAVVSQLNTALCHLGSMGIIHADLKPNNIMVVDRRMKPLRVKVIDFGLAQQACDRHLACVQTTPYRAPEVCVLYPFTEAIDMWSLGVVAAEMAIGLTLFPSALEYDVLSYIIATLGQPPDHVLNQARATGYYFHYQRDGPQRWRLKTPQDFHVETGCVPADNRQVCLRSLDDLLVVMDLNSGENQDYYLLVDLIKKMMHLDPEQRIKPQEVLEHPFLTEHLPKRCVDHVVIDMTDKEQHQQSSLNETPGPQIIHQQVQKRCVDHVVIDMPEEEEQQQSSLNETPGPEIIHQQVQKRCVDHVVIDMPEEEEQQQSSLNGTPGPEIIHQQVQKRCVDHVIIDMPEEEEQQQSSLNETPGPEIIHQQVQKRCDDHVVIDMPDDEEQQQSSLNETPGPEIIHQQVQKNLSKPPQELEKTKVVVEIQPETTTEPENVGWFRLNFNCLVKTLGSIFCWMQKKISSVSPVGLFGDAVASTDASQLEGSPV